MAKRTQRQNDGRREQYAMAKLLDDKREFEDWRAEIAPKLAAMMKEGKKAQDIIDFMQSYAVARVATIVFTEEDSARALAAARDILDRGQGKAVERQETTHKFSKLADDELDAVLQSRLKQLSDTTVEDVPKKKH